jgi:hypothetical protein
MTGKVEHGKVRRLGPRADNPAAADGGDDGEVPPDMNMRLTKLEATVDGLKRVQDFTLVAVLGVGAIIVTFSVYGLQRFDQLSEKVNDMPNKISAELRDITKTLATSITASKQQVPQVILIPYPPPKTNSEQ